LHLAALELASDATPQEIRAAWSRLVKLHHPDSTGISAANRFQEVHEAYRALGSPGAPKTFAA